MSAHWRSAVISSGRAAVRAWGMATAAGRPDPEFLIIGAKRGGSTSFYYDLLGHPQVAPLFPRPDHLPKATATKGVHYFDQNYERGERWYRSHLPSRAARAMQARRTASPVITGEASPYYLFHPAAAERAHRLLPHARIIAILRDPVERTYSHWKERRRSDMEDLDFAAALAAEAARVGNVDERLCREPAFHSYAHEQQSYAQQSEYDTALQRWYDHFPRDQILVLAAEDYYADANSALATVQRFLDLPVRELASGSVRNAAAGAEMAPAVRSRLKARFEPHNRRLEQLTGVSFAWD